MRGLGFLIWQLSAMPTVDKLIDLLGKHGVRWVSIKLANGTAPFNQTGGNDKDLKAYMLALKEAGFEVGGWHYSYGYQPGPEGDRAMERIEKLEVDHWLVDAESEWQAKAWGAAKDAKLYMSKLKVGGLEVGLCAARYPENFPRIPFSAFLNHEAMDVNTPQVYWEGAHNPAQQLDRSLAQYQKITDRPFLPIGATYGHTQSDKTWWQPTEADLIEFVNWCKAKRVRAYGFYSLDWIIQKGMYNWLSAISGVAAGDPPPVEPPPAEPGGLVKMRVIASALNVRSGPGATYRVVDTLVKDETVEIADVDGKDAWVKIASGQYACAKVGAARYLEPIP